jgi:hypothetical protein
VEVVVVHLLPPGELRTRGDAIYVTDSSFSHRAILDRIDH